jgi:hypothetical protein
VPPEATSDAVVAVDAGETFDPDAVTSPAGGSVPGPADTSVDTSTDGHPTHRRWFPTTAVLVYLACRLLTVVAVAVADLRTHNSIVADLTTWDGTWFLRAVRHGYPAHLPMVDGHVAANPIAFFPLFPLMVRGLAALGIAPGAGALLLSGATGASAVVAVGSLARRLAGDSAARRAALLFAVFPGTFAFSFAYSEGIVVTCVGFGLLALLDRRFWLAGVLGAVATAASPVALAFVVSCAWSGIRAARAERRPGPLVAPVLAPAGFAAYMVYLWIHTGTTNAWRLTERGGWHSWPSATYPFRILWAFLHDPVSPTLTGHILFVGTVAAVVGTVLMVKEHQPAPVFLFGVCAAGAAALSQPVGLRPRFLMLAFPMVIAAGTRYRGWTHRALVVVSFVLLILMTILETGSHAVFP